MITKNEKKKNSKDRYRSRYLISQHGTFIQLYLLNLLNKNIFLLNQMITKLNTCLKLFE